MKKTGNDAVGCGCGIILLVFNLLLGSWSVNYLLLFFAGKTIPFIGAVAIGLFVGQFSVPVAFVVAILRGFGVL